MSAKDTEHEENWAREDAAKFKRDLVRKIASNVDLSYWDRAEPLARIYSLMFGRPPATPEREDPE